MAHALSAGVTGRAHAWVSLSQKLGVPRMKRWTFLRQYVFPRVPDIPAELRDRTMLQVLRGLAALALEDKTFNAALRKVAFIPVADGSLQMPEALYDPRVPELVSRDKNQVSF